MFDVAFPASSVETAEQQTPCLTTTAFACRVADLGLFIMDKLLRDVAAHLLPHWVVHGRTWNGHPWHVQMLSRTVPLIKAPIMLA